MKDRSIDRREAREYRSYEERMAAAKGYLSSKFDAMDETWIVGHKGDHAQNLQNLGALGDRIDVAHVHSTLGVNSQRLIPPPDGSSSSYKGILTEANPDLEEEVARVVDQGRSVVVMMPFPNRGLEQAIVRNNAERNFTSTAPVPEYDSFTQIEDKIQLGRDLDRILESIGMEENRIPWTIYDPSRHTLEKLREELDIDEGRSLYFQKALSAGGDGTVRVSNEQTCNELLSIPEWAKSVESGRVKVSAEVENAYPANGTGCIIPTPDGECVVLVDPPSHKPVGLEELNAKEGSGVGNDWSEPYPEHIQEQYRAIVVATGKYLYKKYGVTGLFGPDGLVNHQYQMTEVNPRWQGTTPYQTLNAIKNKRVPLEIVHYMVKFAKSDPGELNAVLDIVGDPDEYNDKALKETGGFYIKVGGPKQKRRVKEDLNGPWVWDGQTMLRVDDESLTPMSVYLNGTTGEQRVFWIKAPKENEEVGGELAPIGYITGSGFTVFNPDQPGITPQAKSLYDQVVSEMLE